jgi:hypothetical protein
VALKAQALDLLASAQPEKHEWLFGRVGITTGERLEFVRAALESSEEDRALLPRRNDHVPRVIHRLWLTNPTEPRLPPDAYLARIREQARRLPHFEVVFWVNCDAVASRIAQLFDAAPLGDRTAARIVSIDALKDELIHARIQSAIAARKFVLAGDILKHFLIARFGGIYADFGVDFGADLTELVLDSDITLFLANELFFQPALMAAPAGSRPFQLFHKLMLTPEILTACCVTEAEPLTAGTEIWMHGGIAFTISLILFGEKSDRLLPVPPNRGLLHVESLGSWYRQTDNYGGVSLRDAALTHIDPVKLKSIRQRIAVLSATNSKWSRSVLAKQVIMRELEQYL